MLESVATCFQPLGEHTLPVKHQALRHLAEHEFQHETGQRGKRRPTEYLSECFRKQFLRERLRCGQVEHALARLGHHEVMDGVDLIVERNP